eukprot:7377854-Prymnesium_polylepis.1
MTARACGEGSLAWPACEHPFEHVSRDIKRSPRLPRFDGSSHIPAEDPHPHPSEVDHREELHERAVPTFERRSVEHVVLKLEVEHAEVVVLLHGDREEPYWAVDDQVAGATARRTRHPRGRSRANVTWAR